MRVPRPMIVAFVAVVLFCLFLIDNRQPIRVGFLVTSTVTNSNTLMLISCALGAVVGFALGLLVRRRTAR